MSIVIKGKKNTGGRPKEDLAKKVDFNYIRKLALSGMTDVQIGAALGVTEMTVNRWKEDQRFALALKKGKGEADQRVVESLYQKALGYEYEEVVVRSLGKGKSGKEITTTHKTMKFMAPDTTACIFWLKNRQPSLWRDRKELTGKDGQPLNGPNKAEDMTDAELAIIASGENPDKGKATRH